MKLTAKSSKGFTLVEIMIVVAIIGILIAIAVPGFVKARTQSRAKACQENLTKIEGAVEQWALENNKKPVDCTDITTLVGADNYLKKNPICPSGGTYTLNAGVPECSIGTAEKHSLADIGTAPAA
jgi:prepilin-type N-terminal cleavage/methylation domain-containing protein